MRYALGILTVAALLMASSAAAQPVVIDVGTNYLNDTLYVGQPAEIRFNIDAGPYEIMTVCLSFEWNATNGLSISQLSAFDPPVNLIYSPFASVFASKPYTNMPANSDSVIIGAVSFGGPWEGSHLFATVLLQPQDTGTIFVDSITLPPANHVSVFDDGGAELPIDWRPGPIVVAPCTYEVGDLNHSSTITLADIIMLVNYVFKMGAPPSPNVAIGNADCMGAITSSDIIYLVNHQGKGGPPPPCPCYNP